MEENKIELIENFWMQIDIAEEYVRQYGAHGWNPAYRDVQSREPEAAYREIEPLLETLARKRMVITPPGALGFNPFSARTAHEALMLLLDPPDNLFGQVWILRSPEYVQIKREAQEELRRLQAPAGVPHEKPDASSGGTSRPRSRRGRPVRSDKEADKRIWDAWASGSYRRHEDLARSRGKGTQEIKRALDRHRKRVRKSNRAGIKRPPEPRQVH